MTAKPVLACRDLVKRYGAVTAVNGVSLELYEGHVLALLGDNGAGKSSVVKMLSGASAPDAGQILFRDQPVHFGSSRDARQLGIEAIWQDLALARGLDAGGNIFLGREIVSRGLPRLFGVLNQRRMSRVAASTLSELGIEVSPKTPVSKFSGGQAQAVAIARAMVFPTSVLFMDEPTAALGVSQAGKVRQLIRRVANEGCTVCLVSHSLPEVFEVADHVAVLRHGRLVRHMRCDEASEDVIVSLMVGAGEVSRERGDT
jgi:ABC-type sugar transport system ATPase subunit